MTGAAGQHRVRDHRGPREASGGTFHLLDLTPVAGPHGPGPGPLRHDRDGLKADSPTRMQGARRARHPGRHRAGARPPGAARRRRWPPSRRSSGRRWPAHYHSRRPHRSAGGRARPRFGARRSAGGSTCCCTRPAWRSAAPLPEKQPREFDLVFDVKSDGWFNVVHAARDLPIGVTVAFSSVAGRFGNAGQTDYAAANDLLCKVASSLRRTRPDTRALALDWTAWGGIGMATRGSIPKIMAKAGIELLLAADRGGVDPSGAHRARPTAVRSSSPVLSAGWPRGLDPTARPRRRRTRHRGDGRGRALPARAVPWWDPPWPSVFMTV